MKRVIMLGPPGSGKGTQAAMLAKKQSLVAISSGEMFRDAMRTGSEVGLEAKRYMDAGELVPDETTIRLVTERLEQPSSANGYILDGFPRTIPQAKALGEKVAIDGVIEITCHDDAIIQRMSGRRVHIASGRTYHIKHNPPKQEGVDDVTGEPLEQRPDDAPETVAKRLAVYTKQTKPLSDYYKAGGEGMPAYHSIDGDRPIEVVTADLFALFD